MSPQVHSCKFLHKIWSSTFLYQHKLPPQRSSPKVASVSWSTDIWNQQILTYLKKKIDFSSQHWTCTFVFLATIPHFMVEEKLLLSCLNCAGQVVSEWNEQFALPPKPPWACVECNSIVFAVSQKCLLFPQFDYFNPTVSVFTWVISNFDPRCSWDFSV